MSIRIQYSLRALIVPMFIVAILFGGRSIYFKSWQAHCKRLEPSLFGFILQHSGDYGDIADRETYIVKGVPLDPQWTVLSKEYLEAIGLEGLRSDGVSGADAVFYMGRIRWVDWKTVIVDFGHIDAKGRGHGFQDAQYTMTQEGWTCIKSGIEWLTPPMDEWSQRRKKETDE